ncbi:MAG: hypothetical protein KAT37_02615, partial [Candidatus Aenigmarchaeota archaeon]|nr:hypothetical protein [Candidatus Aenigmarchaeota archaeon]
MGEVKRNFVSFQVAFVIFMFCFSSLTFSHVPDYSNPNDINSYDDYNNGGEDTGTEDTEDEAGDQEDNGDTGDDGPPEEEQPEEPAAPAGKEEEEEESDTEEETPEDDVEEDQEDNNEENTNETEEEPTNETQDEQPEENTTEEEPDVGTMKSLSFVSPMCCPPIPRPSLSLDPDDAEGCDESSSITVTNTADEEKDLAKNVVLEITVVKGSEYVDSVDYDGDIGDIPAGESVDFPFTISTNSAWDTAPADAEIKIKITVTNEDNWPLHNEGKHAHYTLLRCLDCSYWETEGGCNTDPDCDWCDKCNNGKVNQWLEDRCVPAETDCGYDCVQGYCGAECDKDEDCPCPQDKCVDLTWYDYPLHGTCPHCPCLCHDGTGSGQPCESQTVNCDDGDPCTLDSCDAVTGCSHEPIQDCCMDDSDCPDDYYDCVGNSVMWHDVYCDQSTHTCEEDTQEEENCDDYNQDDCDGTWWIHQTGECVENGDVHCAIASSTGNCDNDLYCDGQETCDVGECFDGIAIDCSHLDDQCNEGICNEDDDQCEQVPANEGDPCDDGLFCNIGEICQSGICTGGSPRDCSAYDKDVNECFYDPDAIDFTYDFYDFDSVCDEDQDECTEKPSNWEDLITHECDIVECGAECEEEDLSQCTDTERCNGFKRETRSVTDCSDVCECEYDCWSGGVCDIDCGAECETDEDCPVGICADDCTCVGECTTDEDCNHLDNDYCSGDSLMHEEGVCIDYYCEVSPPTEVKYCYYYEEYCDGNEVWYEQGYCNPSTVSCDSESYFIEDCYFYNQYCSGTEVWYEEGYCNLGYCDSNEDFVEDCNDDLYCNGQETCDAGECFDGTAIDCSGFNLDSIETCFYMPDGIDYTWDYFAGFTSECNEETDSCT